MEAFPLLVSVATNLISVLVDHLAHVGGMHVWSPIFRRNLNEEEMESICDALSHVQNISILGGNDLGVWHLYTNGLLYKTFNEKLVTTRIKSDFLVYL